MLHALLILFFIYYYLLDRQLLAFVICAVKNVISPLVLAVLFSVLLKSHVGMWIGLAAAPVLATAVIARTLYARCPREEFPFLLPWDKDDKTYIFDFEISPENAVVISRTTDTVLHMFSKPESVCKLIGLFAEEMLILIQEKNADAKVDSFRQYVVANMMLSIDNKAYITTTGYNRNELFFPDPV